MQINEQNNKPIRLHSEVKRQTIGYIVAALGLVAGLAWNDAIKSMIERFFPLGQGSLWAKFIYAVIITIVVVLVSYLLLKNKKSNE